MASETRKIVFTLPELGRAMSIFGKKTDRAFPDGDVNSIGSSGSGREQMFSLLLENKGIEDTTVRFNRGDMLTALLLMCRMDGVPVPRSGEKVLKTDAQGLILYVKTEMSVQHTLANLD